MAKKNQNCEQCGQLLIDNKCVNTECENHEESNFESLPMEGSESVGFQTIVPEDLQSMDPSQVIDFTGTIGSSPISGSGDFDLTNQNGTETAHLSQMVDDQVYQQVQRLFPTEDASESVPQINIGNEPVDENVDIPATIAPTITVPDLRVADFEEVLPPVRDIVFPSDTASLGRTRSPSPDSLEGDEYSIVGKLGEGGYGIVFEASQTALSRNVAVKVLKPKKRRSGSRTPSGSGTGASGTGTGETHRRQRDFLHEAKITARLQHPNIVPVYDFGVNTKGELFYSMKKVEERPWSSFLHSPSRLLGIPKSEVDDAAKRDAINKNVEIFMKVCDAMAYTHSQKIIHRDLKPQNVMVGGYGEVQLIDFGMALDLADGTPQFSAGGTLVYMSPEMAEHFAKQREIQVTAQKTALQMGEEQGTVFLDQSSLIGIGRLAKKLLAESKDESVLTYARKLVELDQQEVELAAKIDHRADVYLLGAILYQIAIGHPPHFFPVEKCQNYKQNPKKARKEKFQKELWLARRNGIQQYSTTQDPLRVSLRDIAIRAMRTDLDTRFQTVEELQAALSDFQLQVQSLALIETGKRELELSEKRDDYQHLLPAMESFRGAKSIWSETQDTGPLQIDAACRYGERAHIQKDFDAGLGILNEYVDKEDQDNPKVVSVRNKLRDGKRKRIRNRRLAWIASLAAIILPIVVGIGASYFATQIYQGKVETAQNEVRDANQKVKDADQRVIDANQKVKDADQRVIDADQKVADADQKVIDANQKVVDADQKVADADQKVIDANQKVIDANQKVVDANQKVVDANQKVADAAQRVIDADQKVVDAAQKVDRAERDAEKFQFDAIFGAFNSTIRGIPIDLRNGNLTNAKEKLLSFRDSNSPEQLKNGWLVRNYQKRLEVDFPGMNADALLALGKEADGKGEDHKVISVIPTQVAGESFVLTKQANGQQAIWKFNVDGTRKKLNWSIPQGGKLASGDLSPNGQTLVLAFDKIERVAGKLGAPLYLVDTRTGREAARVGYPDRFTFTSTEGITASNSISTNNKVIGCRTVKFVNDNELVTIEELGGYQQINKRLQITTRKIIGGEAKVVDVNGNKFATTLVSATTRDQASSVEYLADIYVQNSKVYAAVAFRGLKSDASGISEVIKLQTFKQSSGGQFLSSDQRQREIQQFPTAIHIANFDQNGNVVLLGQNDGTVLKYLANNLTSTPQAAELRNEDKIVSIRSTVDGNVVSGSENGRMVLWKANANSDNPLQFVKILQGQPGNLTSLEFATPLKTGATLAVGDNSGSVRFWNPESGEHDSTLSQRTDLIDLDSNIRVTSGAVDQSSKGQDVPSAAYGTAKGDIYVYRSEQMIDNADGMLIEDDDLLTSDLKRMKIESPFQSFSVGFNEFEGMGIVADRFVSLRKDGTFFFSSIDEAASASALEDTGRYELTKNPRRGFTPIISTSDQVDHFVSTHPVDSKKLIFWKLSESGFSGKSITLSSGKDRGEIRKIAMSPDGNWVATIRKRTGKALEAAFVTEVFRVDAVNSTLTLARMNPRQRSELISNQAFTVGAPTFIAFSKTSQEFAYHFHGKIDKSTKVESWTLGGDSWNQNSESQILSDRLERVVGWDSERFITRLNNQYQLAQPVADFDLVSKSKIESSSDDNVDPIQRLRNRPKAVFPAMTTDQYYVLYSDRIEVVDRELTPVPQSVAEANNGFKNAQGMKVFADRGAVVFDDEGLHLVNGSIRTRVAARQNVVKSLSLSSGKLAAIYGSEKDEDGSDGLCKVFDVTGDTEVLLTQKDEVRSVSISSDGKYVSMIRENEILIYSLAEEAKDPQTIATKGRVKIDWIISNNGANAPRLLIVEQVDENLAWQEWDPAIGQANDPTAGPDPLELPKTFNGQIDSFEFADKSRKFLAFQTDDSVDVWSVEGEKYSDESDRIRPQEGATLTAITFSEIAGENIGTRLVVLTNSGGEANGDSEASYYLVVSDDKKEPVADDKAAKGGDAFAEGGDANDVAEPVAEDEGVAFKVEKIDGALDNLEGLSLIDVRFSGDGRTLSQVHTKGIEILLSKNPELNQEN